MSLESWKKEFYPVAADNVSKAKALAHSLRKWQGLTAENLKKHELTKDAGRLISDIAGNSLGIDGGSCALCTHYLDLDTGCQRCPLSFVRGMACDKPLGGSPYRSWSVNDDPAPMIELIELAIAAKGAKK